MKDKNPTANEPDIQIQFQGYTVDFFKFDSGSLGLTIERSPWRERNTCIDLIISQDLQVSGDISKRSKQAIKEPTTLEISNVLDAASLYALLSAAGELLNKEAARVSNTEVKPEYTHAANLVAAISGYMTEQGTTTEQDELLRLAGFKLPLQPR